MLRRRLEEAGFTRAEPRIRSGAAEKGGSQHAGPLSKAEQRGGGSGCWSEGGREGVAVPRRTMGWGGEAHPWRAPVLGLGPGQALPPGPAP